MKNLFSLFLFIILASCSQQIPPLNQTMGGIPSAIEPSKLLEQEIENVNQELALKQQYAISQEDLALLKNEEILTEEELQELAKFVN